MTVRLKCKNCDRIYLINLSSSEYFLPTRCPDCGYLYRNDAALRLWLEELRRQMEEDKRRGK